MDYYVLDLVIANKNISKSFNVIFSLNKFSYDESISYRINEHSLMITNHDDREYRIVAIPPDDAELVKIVDKTFKRSNAKQTIEGIANILINVDFPELFEEFYMIMIKKLNDINAKIELPVWLDIVIEHNKIIKSLNTLKQHIGDVEAINIQFKADNLENTKQLFLLDEKLSQQKNDNRWYRHSRKNKSLMTKMYCNMSESDKLEEKYSQNSTEINSTLNRINILQKKRDQLKEKITDNLIAINFIK